MIGLSVLKGRKVALPCSYWSTCTYSYLYTLFIIDYIFKIVIRCKIRKKRNLQLFQAKYPVFIISLVLPSRQIIRTQAIESLFEIVERLFEIKEMLFEINEWLFEIGE